MEKIEYPYFRKNSFSGVLDKNLKKLEKRLGISLSVRGDSLLIDGNQEKIEFAKHFFNKMRELEEKGNALKEDASAFSLGLNQSLILQFSDILLYFATAQRQPGGYVIQ